MSSPVAQAIDDSNILLFTKTTIGKDFSFYIRNLYIATAHSRNMSMIEFLTDYGKGITPDPDQINSDAKLLYLYDLFDWSILEILNEISPELAEEKPVDKLLHTRTAIIHLVQTMFADYKVKRD